MPIRPTQAPCVSHHPYYVAFLFLFVDSWLQEGASVSQLHPRQQNAKAQKEYMAAQTVFLKI